MSWLWWFVPLALFAGVGAWIVGGPAYDWFRATRKLVAPWRDADPYENKPRKKVWFP